jgi:hypothetical protein
MHTLTSLFVTALITTTLAVEPVHFTGTITEVNLPIFLFCTASATTLIPVAPCFTPTILSAMPLRVTPFR